MTDYIKHIADDIVDRLSAEIDRRGGVQSVRAKARLYGSEFAPIARGEGASAEFKNELAKLGLFLVVFESRDPQESASSSTDAVRERVSFSVAICARSLVSSEHLYRATSLAEIADVLNGAPVSLPGTIAVNFSSVSGYTLGSLVPFVLDPDVTILTLPVSVDMTRLASHKIHYATPEVAEAA